MGSVSGDIQFSNILCLKLQLSNEDEFVNESMYVKAIDDVFNNDVFLYSSLWYNIKLSQIV